MLNQKDKNEHIMQAITVVRGRVSGVSGEAKESLPRNSTAYISRCIASFVSVALV